MGLDKICIGLAVLFVFMGAACGAEAWIKENPNATSVRMSDLTATIHIHIKNNKDHVQYFKISQKYFKTDPDMEWKIIWTNPPAVKMIKSIYPELGGDYGWEIKPGETKTICFKLENTGPYEEWYIINNASIENQYWPIIPEPGIFATWFFPNEIEMLNPDLDLQVWEGTFTFLLTNVDSKKIAGIVRAPIVPMDSRLTYSDPHVTFVDNDLTMGANIAAWNVVMNPYTAAWFTYKYEWPSSTIKTVSGESITSPSIPTTKAATTPTVPTKETGVPYGLFVIGAIITGAGVVYAKFMR